ncbi:MAG: hypothetical protein R3E53_07705 [Myxococcota bacterium]
MIDKVAPIVGAGATLGWRSSASRARRAARSRPRRRTSGSIRIELDDCRARVTATETTQPNLELDLAGGEAAAPA